MKRQESTTRALCTQAHREARHARALEHRRPRLSFVLAERFDRIDMCAATNMCALDCSGHRITRTRSVDTGRGTAGVAKAASLLLACALALARVLKILRLHGKRTSSISSA
eukprot:5846283-Prymnesium_polylepis.1